MSEQPGPSSQQVAPDREVSSTQTIKTYTPPGKTLNIMTWDCLDVQLWMTQFIPEEARAPVFLALEKEKIDGEALSYLVLSAPDHYNMDIEAEAYESIIKHAEVVCKAFAREETVDCKREEDEEEDFYNPIL